MTDISDMQIGKAGEYLVCADLILSGLVAFPSEQGVPYDVILSAGDVLYKVQVKATRKPKNIPQRKTDIPAYIFHIGNNGKRNVRKKYDKQHVDIFALVALDTKKIAYIPFFDVQTTMNFRVPEMRGKYHDEQGVRIKEDVLKMKNGGVALEEIARLKSLKISSIYRYSANVSLEQKGTNAGVYFDEFTLERCLKICQKV